MGRATRIGLVLRCLAVVATFLTVSAATADGQASPFQIPCALHQPCQACRRGCDGNAFCRRLCAYLFDQCVRSNGCDFTFPFCADPLARSSCRPAYPYQCATVRLVNRTGSDVVAIRINGLETGRTVSPGATVSILADPSREGLTVTAASAAARDAAGAPCTWTVTRAACLNEMQVARVVFRRGSSSCRAATPAPY